MSRFTKVNLLCLQNDPLVPERQCAHSKLRRNAAHKRCAIWQCLENSYNHPLMKGWLQTDGFLLLVNINNPSWANHPLKYDSMKNNGLLHCIPGLNSSLNPSSNNVSHWGTTSSHEFYTPTQHRSPDFVFHVLGTLVKLPQN